MNWAGAPSFSIDWIAAEVVLPWAAGPNTVGSGAIFLNSAVLASLFWFRSMPRQTPIMGLAMAGLCAPLLVFSRCSYS